MPTCRYLTNHAHLHVSNYWSPCCIFDQKYVKTRTNNLREYKTSADFNEIKSAMVDGWHPGCSECHKDEMAKKFSPRRRGARQLSGIEGIIEDIEISLSNECNLTCKMCGPTFSTKWQKLVATNHELQSWYQKKPTEHADLLDVMSQLDITKLKNIKYLGGEPFITKEITQLFELLDEKSSLENITFFCHTNCTLLPEKNAGYLSRMKKLKIGLSIDGIGDHAEYIRAGFSWDRVNDVIGKWMQMVKARATLGFNDDLFLYTTVQAYNLHHIPEITRYAYTNGIRFDYRFLEYPRQASVAALPPSYKQKVIEDIASDPFVPTRLIKQARLVQSQPELVDDLRRWTLDLDRAMGTSIASVIPDLAKYLTEG